MQFLLAIFLFVVVIGWLDSRLPWPAVKKEKERRWGSRSAIVVGLVAVSHWALDLIVHHADMAILPGNLENLPRRGFGLWDYPMLAAALEALLVLLGAGFYWRAAREVCLS